MRLFGPLYDWTLAAAARPRAPQVLGVVSFTEAIFFPIPVDVMLAPMVISHPRRWLYYAGIASATSIAGGIFGYLLGVWAYDFSTSYLVFADGDVLNEAKELLQEYGFWVILAAAFMPIPYKVFTLAAGFLAMPFVLFVIGSVIGRTARFLLVAGVAYWMGSHYEAWIRRHIELIGWVLVAALVVFIWMHQQ